MKQYTTTGRKKIFSLISVFLLAGAVILFAVGRFIPVMQIIPQTVSLVLLMAGLYITTRYLLTVYVYVITDKDYSAGGIYHTGRSVIVYKRSGKIDREILQYRLISAEVFTDKKAAEEKAKEEDITFRYNFSVVPGKKNKIYILSEYGSERILSVYDNISSFGEDVKNAINTEEQE